MPSKETAMQQLTTLAQSATSHTLDVAGSGLSEEGIMFIVIMGIGGLVVLLLFTVVIPVALHHKNEKEREQTKREIAAYAAEGSISPEDATAMIKAAQKPTFDWMGRRC
ncbi:MAG: hypothetical protein Tsb0013_10990 [Phycisphaerales bacterium]